MKHSDICQHGSSVYGETYAASDGEQLTECCGAYFSVFSDDGSLYCKCCYCSVVGFRDGSPVVVYRVELPDDSR